MWQAINWPRYSNFNLLPRVEVTGIGWKRCSHGAFNISADSPQYKFKGNKITHMDRDIMQHFSDFVSRKPFYLITLYTWHVLMKKPAFIFMNMIAQINNVITSIHTLISEC